MRIRARFFAAACTAAIAFIPIIASAQATAASQATLQAELDQINQQIAANQAQLATEQQARSTLENEVSILDSQIQEAQLEIKQRNLTIEQVEAQIAQAQSGISNVNTEVSAGEHTLAQIMRETNEINETPLAIQILQGSLQQAFADIG